MAVEGNAAIKSGDDHAPRFDSTSCLLPAKLLLLAPSKRSLTFTFPACLYAAFVFVSWLLPLLYVSITQDRIVSPSKTLLLPYVRDLNVAVICLVSAPILLLLLLREKDLLSCVFTELREEGVLQGEPQAFGAAMTEWQRRFARINLLAQALGVASAIVACSVSYQATLDLHGRSWQTVGAPPGAFNFSGWLFLVLQVAPFYFLLAVTVVREVGVVLMLRGITRSFPVDVQPLHPDGVGGLRPVARVAIHYQLIIAMVGVNIGSLIVVMRFLGLPAAHVYTWSTIPIYLVLAPLSFVAPLLPFRQAMLKSKRNRLRWISRHFRRGLKAVEQEVTKGTVKEDQLSRLEQLQKIHATIRRLPEWPLDFDTVRKFMATLLIPAVSALVSWALGQILKALG